MKNKNYIKDLNDIKKMVGHIKSLNESLTFNEEYDDSDFQDVEEPQYEQMPPMDPEQQGETEQPLDKETEGMDDFDMEKSTDIDQIREIALKGMVRLCKNPEDQTYQALKKIFTFCDKAVEPKDEETKK